MTAPSGGRPLPPRIDVALMEGYFSAQVNVAVRLNSNEAPDQPPPAFIEQLCDEIASMDFNRYPDREAVALRSAIGALHGVSYEQVYPANGSNEVLQSILLAYGGTGRTAAVFEPTYALHSHIARITGTGLIIGARDESYSVGPAELDEVLAKGTAVGPHNPAVIFLCSPNNPTGTIEPSPNIARVLAKAPGLVVIDEAYGQFSRSSALAQAVQDPAAIVVRTFSKTWSLAGLRLGYAIAAKEVVEDLYRVTLPYHLDVVKQAAGRIAVEYLDDMNARVARIVEERGRIEAGLLELGMMPVPSEANFVLFHLPHSDARHVWSELVARSVLVRDVSSWPSLEGSLRVTVGSREETDAFLDALAGILSSPRSPGF